MDTSVFMDLSETPGTADLEIHLKNTFTLWQEIREFVLASYPAAMEEWHVFVKKYGWVFRIMDKKRAIIYLSPREGFFKVSFVFGQKATDRILESDISEAVKEELMKSKVYMEGRLISLDIYDETFLSDIKKLVEIKLSN